MGPKMMPLLFDPDARIGGLGIGIGPRPRRLPSRLSPASCCFLRVFDEAGAGKEVGGARRGGGWDGRRGLRSGRLRRRGAGGTQAREAAPPGEEREVTGEREGGKKRGVER